mmetsp:Transcript_17792/g.43914  ORF Transcript_17792/g.43914 Transcript_17792/m.43914 type:complete len:136 (-) Transcript_17792:2250-2657(-)
MLKQCVLLPTMQPVSNETVTRNNQSLDASIHQAGSNSSHTIILFIHSFPANKYSSFIIRPHLLKVLLSHWRILFNQVLTKGINVARVSIFPNRIQIDIPIVHVAGSIGGMTTSAATAAFDFGRFFKQARLAIRHV